METFERWQRAAFVAFQTGASKEGETFKKYLRRIGLKDPRDRPAQPKPKEAQARITYAQRVALADKKRRRQT